MNYTFTEKEVEMMYNWGMYADGESGFNEEEKSCTINWSEYLRHYKKKKIMRKRL